MAGAQTAGNELLVYFLKDTQDGASGRGVLLSNCEEEVTD